VPPIPNNRTATQQQLDAANLYADLLEEAKGRIFSIDAVIGGREGIPHPVARECAYLQLRMLCEVIALGCLVAHGNLSATQAVKLQKEYAADKIIKRLDGLHPNFYPHAIRLTVTPGHVHFDRLEAGFLTKAEPIKLYAECGEELHRGSLKRLLNAAVRTQVTDFGDIVGWRNRIVTLLDQHHIASLDNLSHFICVLQRPEAGNHASVAIALSPLPT
jgi:hypothetical protein